QLESVAQAYRATYESYLKRYTEIIQQQSAPILEARLISPASVPKEPSAPRKGLILALSVIFGSAAGLAGAVVLSSFDRTVRLPSQLNALGLTCLAVLPLIRRTKRKGYGEETSSDAQGVERQLPPFGFTIGLQRAKTALRMIV